MRLTFSQPYKSIHSLEDVDLPNLTVICGKNGTGKTHLLEAISNGSLLLNLDYGAAVNPVQISIDISPTWVMHAKIYEIRADIENTFGVVRNIIDHLHAHPRDNPNRAAIDIADRSKIIRYAKSKNILDDVDEIFDEFDVLACVNLLYKGALNSISANFSDFDIATICALYKIGLEENLKLRYFRDTSKNNALTDEEFISIFGPPPWDEFNKIIQIAAIDYEFRLSAETQGKPLTLELFDKHSKSPVSISDLSSGEKVILTFAFSAFAAINTSLSFKKFKTSVFLLDETDSRLHPSLLKVFIDIVNDYLVKSLGLPCILVSHSPVTAALSPPGSLFELVKQPRSLVPQNNHQAVAALVSGVPNLRVSLCPERSVFVESHSDRDILEKVYTYIKPNLDSETDLRFIPVGGKKKSGEAVHTGASVVKRIVGELRKNGNEDIYGIIDWDLTNSRDKNILVLAEGERYAIENAILDPLLIAALLIKKSSRIFSAHTSNTFISLASIHESDLQDFVNCVEDALGFSSDEESVEVEYQGGFSMFVKSKLLQMRGHDLEDLYKERIPELVQFESKGGLKINVVREVVRELPRFTPACFGEVFSAIC